MSGHYGDDVTIVRAPFKVDKYGNPTSVRDWASAERIPIKRVSVQPDSSTEAVGDRSTVTTGWRLFTPKGRDFPALPGDRVEYAGMALDVDGEIARFTFMGRIHHTEVRLKRVAG